MEFTESKAHSNFIYCKNYLNKSCMIKIKHVFSCTFLLMCIRKKNLQENNKKQSTQVKGKVNLLLP